jgi:hypothetical protein
MKTKPKPKKVAQGVSFEKAMVWLRRGKAIRRLAWHLDSKIFRVGHEVFVRLPAGFVSSPGVWKPYPADFLAADWVKAAD